MTRQPQRGDKVIDNNRIFKKKGYISGIIYDFTDPTNEVIIEIVIEYFSMNFRSPVAYRIELFEWDEQSSTWIIRGEHD